MKTACRVLVIIAAASLVVSIVLFVVARSQELHAMQGFPEGCVFDESCDTVPGVIAARHLRDVGLTVLDGTLVVAGVQLAIAVVARARRRASPRR